MSICPRSLESRSVLLAGLLGVDAIRAEIVVWQAWIGCLFSMAVRSVRMNRAACKIGAHLLHDERQMDAAGEARAGRGDDDVIGPAWRWSRGCSAAA